MSVGDPMTKQRSPWQEIDPGDRGLDLASIGSEGVRMFVRQVGDGTLRSILAHEEGKWHLSISFVDHKGNPRRYPKWDEISHARYELMPADLYVAMILPPPDEFVAVHATTFHLHEIDP